MNIIDFIGRKIEAKNLPLEKCNTVCAFSGEKITEGVSLEIAIKKTFNDYVYLHFSSTHISRNAYVCIAAIPENDLNADFRNAIKQHRIEQEEKAAMPKKKNPKKKRIENFELRKYHFLITEKELRILKREELQALLMLPPEPPFVLSVTKSNKKHRSFKALIVFDRDKFPVALDNMNVTFDREKAIQVLPIMQSWYTILPGKESTKQQPTWFWKNHIEFGCMNQKMIAAYGINKYFSENQILEQFRGEPWFSLLLFTLNKEGQ